MHKEWCPSTNSASDPAGRSGSPPHRRAEAEEAIPDVIVVESDDDAPDAEAAEQVRVTRSGRSPLLGAPLSTTTTGSARSSQSAQSTGRKSPPHEKGVHSHHEKSAKAARSPKVPLAKTSAASTSALHKTTKLGDPSNKPGASTVSKRPSGGVGAASSGAGPSHTDRSQSVEGSQKGSSASSLRQLTWEELNMKHKDRTQRLSTSGSTSSLPQKAQRTPSASSSSSNPRSPPESTRPVSQFARQTSNTPPSTEKPVTKPTGVDKKEKPVKTGEKSKLPTKSVDENPFFSSSRSKRLFCI